MTAMDEREMNLGQENTESVANENGEHADRPYTATGNYRQSEEMIQQRRGDRIASGVIGALVGALLTLLIMVPFVFSMGGGDYVPMPTESPNQGGADNTQQNEDIRVSDVVDSEKLDLNFGRRSPIPT